MKFKCKRCGKCCSNAKNLALFEWEAERLRKHGAKIRAGHTIELNGSRIVLFWTLESNGKKCPFLTKRGCLVYNKRPLVCRSFPFMTSGITSKNLEKTLSKECDNLVIPFSYGVKMSKKDALKALSQSYNGSFSSSVILDTAREWIRELVDYAIQARATPEEKEIGLLELLRKYQIMDPKDVEEGIERIENLEVEIDKI
jgi:Fe-S-cluster containining protein